MTSIDSRDREAGERALDPPDRDESDRADGQAASEARLALMVHGPSGSSHAVQLGCELAIGRGPHNDVVFTDRRVSWSHATIVRRDGRVQVRDLGSRNGTELDGKRITEPTPWRIGGLLRIGDHELVLRTEVGPAPVRRPGRGLAIEHVSTGVRFPLRRRRVVIGAGVDADLRLDGAERVVLVIGPDGRAEVDDGGPLAIGTRFTVNGTELRLVPSDEPWSPTTGEEGDCTQYAIAVGLDPDRGPCAVVTDERTGSTYAITAPNRVSLLYFLADALERDRADSVDEPGWRPDEAVAVAVWGKARNGMDPRLLKALIYNVRAELKDAGFDPWCLEKRRGYVRLKVRTAGTRRRSEPGRG
ncbi:MAG: FHA domain-containing protein [Myxococcota bacterium]